MTQTKGTPISSLGEFGLIKKLTSSIVLKNASSIKGVGDDAAILDYQGKQQVVTTDLLVEGVHFNLMYMPLKHLGYKSVMVNLSDVFAMNAIPKQITVSIAISNRFTVEAVEELYAGIFLACEKFGVDVVGGDTTSSLTGLVISITALGEVDANKVVKRNGAKENDLICVSGDLGGAYMGLQLLERENEVFKANPNEQPQLGGYDYILQRQLRPEARGDVQQLLDKLGVLPTSMIDISDGLSSELLHICSQSEVGCAIYEDKIPLDKQTQSFAQELSINPLVAALNGGEDYELLFTVPITEHDKIKNDPDITIIGHITALAGGCNLITGSGNAIVLQAQGWNPLKD
ncbi:MAG: thiamine-phosphate kinase [Mangrovibacterium sp.]